jgi:Effector protein
MRAKAQEQSGTAPATSAGGAGARPPGAGSILGWQRAAGNRAVVQALSGASGAGGAGQLQRMTFNRFTWFGSASNWGWYNEEEKELLELEKSVKDRLATVEAKRDERSAKPVEALKAEFQKVSSGDYAAAKYAEVGQQLRDLRNRVMSVSNNLEVSATARQKLTVVGERTAESKPNEVTQKEYDEVEGIVQDVLSSDKGNLRLEIGPGVERDLSANSSQLGLSVPPELPPLEARIKDAKSKWEALSAKTLPITGEKTSVATNKSLAKDVRDKQLELLDKKIGAIRAEMRPVMEKQEALEQDWDTLVGNMIKMETVKDLVTIAQTEVGRGLLRDTARTSLEEKQKKVAIVAYKQYKPPDAGDEFARHYVNYTPQYFKDRDVQERQPGGAVAKAETLVADNPWQENSRTDITLFHELVHARHYQQGTLIPSEKLVSGDEATADVDKPYENADAPSGVAGVRLEEYATVGLGAFAEDPVTENRYREERRALGENVEARGHYTHKDARGNRAG